MEAGHWLHRGRGIVGRKSSIPKPNRPLIDLAHSTESQLRTGRVFSGAYGGLHHVCITGLQTARMRFLRPTIFGAIDRRWGNHRGGLQRGATRGMRNFSLSRLFINLKFAAHTSDLTPHTSHRHGPALAYVVRNSGEAGYTRSDLWGANSYSTHDQRTLEFAPHRLCMRTKSLRRARIRLPLLFGAAL